MASGDGLGRVLNIIPTADGVEVNMKDAGAVTFIGVGADTYTLQEATSAAGAGAQNLAVIERVSSNASAAGASAWANADQAAAATVVTTAAAVAFTVRAEQLSDGFSYLRVTSTGAGLVYAITHELHVQRKPENLPALGV